MSSFYVIYFYVVFMKMYSNNNKYLPTNPWMSTSRYWSECKSEGWQGCRRIIRLVLRWRRPAHAQLRHTELVTTTHPNLYHYHRFILTFITPWFTRIYVIDSHSHYLLQKLYLSKFEICFTRTKCHYVTLAIIRCQNGMCSKYTNLFQ